MKKLIVVAAVTLMCGSAAFAQNTGAPANAQNDTNKPGMNNMEKGSMEKGSMNNNTSGTSGMSTDSMSKNNPAKEMSKDGSSSAGSKDMKK